MKLIRTLLVVAVAGAGFFLLADTGFAGSAPAAEAVCDCEGAEGCQCGKDCKCGEDCKCGKDCKCGEDCGCQKK